MLVPYWVLFVLLCLLFHQFDSQQPSTTILEFSVKSKPFVLQHCKKASLYTGVSTILGPVCFVVSSSSSFWFTTDFLQFYSGIFSKIKTFCSISIAKKASHYNSVSTILGPICFIVSSFSSVWFTTAFSQPFMRIFSKIKTFCSTALQKKASLYTGVSTILGPVCFVVLLFFIILIHNSLLTIIQEFSVKSKLFVL